MSKKVLGRIIPLRKALRAKGAPSPCCAQTLLCAACSAVAGAVPVPRALHLGVLQAVLVRLLLYDVQHAVARRAQPRELVGCTGQGAGDRGQGSARELTERRAGELYRGAFMRGTCYVSNPPQSSP